MFHGEQYTANQLLNKFKSQKKRSRKVNAYYIELTVAYKGLPLKLWFSRYSKRGNWHLLITTDLSLTFNKAIEISELLTSRKLNLHHFIDKFQIGIRINGFGVVQNFA